MVQHSFSSSGQLDISGPGVQMPDVHLDSSTRYLCGPVYLIVQIDGKKRLQKQKKFNTL